MTRTAIREFVAIPARPLLRPGPLQTSRLQPSNVFEHFLCHLLYLAIGMHLHAPLGARILGHLL